MLIFNKNMRQGWFEHPTPRSSAECSPRLSYCRKNLKSDIAKILSKVIINLNLNNKNNEIKITNLIFCSLHNCFDLNYEISKQNYKSGKNSVNRIRMCRI
ncbi:hypothetical protein MSIBF_A3390003 [groundwater metagenome]|uniref:Uncharacterized protein n=1 Tax=groundwater metagenome TaxID=717931 RepID=A0A098EAZ3_9ZZZZ